MLNGHVKIRYKMLLEGTLIGYFGRSIPGHDPSMKTTGGLMFYHFDGMSSVSKLTDRHGDVIQHYRHDAFGALFTGITAPYNTNSYTGHQYDQDVGLIDMPARWYDASIGRFLQEDTYPGTLDNPLSQNRYAYVMNNPMNFWDPTGRVPEEVRNRENFRVTVYNGDKEERWYYTFKQYSTSTQESQRTRSVLEREIIYSWSEMTIHSWEYEKQLRAIIDANGDLNPVTRDPMTVHYEAISGRDISKNYSAKDLMHDNFEELIKQGVLRGHRTVLFSGTISMRNGEFVSRHLHVGDELRLDRLYDELVWGYSSQPIGTTTENVNFLVANVGMAQGMVLQAYDDVKSIISLLISIHPASPVTYKETLPMALETVGALHRGELSLVDMAKDIGKDLFDEYYGAFEHVINNFAKMYLGQATYEESVEYGRQLFRVTEVLLIAYGTVKIASRVGTKTSGAIQNAGRKSDDIVQGTGIVNNYTKDDLIRIASQPHGKRNTQVGRAYQKHSNRDGTSFTGYRGGDPTRNTNEGLNHLNRILDNPNSTATVRNHNAYGEIIEVKLPSGQGARWSLDGSRFIGFIEP